METWESEGEMDWRGMQQNVMTAAVGGYGDARTATEVSEPSKVRDGITASEQLLSDLIGEVSALEKRLDTVLRPIPPSGNVNGAAVVPTPLCSHVVGRLNILNDGFVSLGARLRELRERVEV